MPKDYIPNWNDEAIRPANSDSQLGWAGVPLVQTLGYYGVIKGAWIPNNAELGFDPEYDAVDADQIATSFAKKLGAAFESNDTQAVLDLFHHDGHWKDVELFTWDVRTLRGHENILPMLKERLSKTAPKNLRINREAPPIVEILGDDLSFITAHLEFDFGHGTGSAVFRLSPLCATTGSAEELADVSVWKIFTMGTSLETIQGWDPEYGDKIRWQKGKVHDPLGKVHSYTELRNREVNAEESFDPQVLIIGAGHCGLGMAARLRVLGISHLIIEKESQVGWSWGNRYSSLSLHAPTTTNHLPCVPFPHWFPVFLPAQQLSKFLKSYADIMDLNVWTNAIADGKNAVYNERDGRWTISVTKADGTIFEFHPRHLIMATGISGTTPNVPDIPGMNEFVNNGGIINHSARHRTGSDWKGKECVVVGAATSAHDITYELSEHGCNVTMIQRNATHVMSVEKSIRYFYRNRDLTNRVGGPRVEIADQFNFLRHPFSVEYELLQRGQQKAREIDHDLLENLKTIGYRLHDGYHGGGAYSLVFFDYGGYYWDTGCCQLLIDGKVKLKHSEIDHFTKDSVVYKDGTRQKADVVVFATGYLDSKSSIQAFMGDGMAKRCKERWEKGNAFFIGPEGDSEILYRPLPQKGLYSIFHQFSFNRFHSARLALRIKAEELGIDTTPYGNRPLGPPSVSAGRQPRPEKTP